MKRIITVFTSFILFFFLGAILNFSKDVIDALTFSISIWKDNLFPSLFPFLILSYFFVNYGISSILSEFIKPVVVNLFHLPSTCGYTIILSLFSGFPSSSKFIKDELDKKEINIHEASHLLKFCHFPSPLFVIGMIGSTLLGSKRLGIMILISTYLGAFFNAIIFKNKKTPQQNSKISIREAFRKVKVSITNSKGFAKVLANAIKDSLDILFLLLGIVSVFLIITTIFTNIIPLNDINNSIFSGILEMSQGIRKVSMLKIDLLYRMLLITFFISFGGLSIHSQVFSILANYNLSYLSYFFARAIHAVVSCLCLIVLYNFF